MMAKPTFTILGVGLAALLWATAGWSAEPLGPGDPMPVEAFFSASLPADASATPEAAVTGLTQPAEAHSVEADARLASANQHLEFGKKLYFQGDLGGARKEFDDAIDALLNAPDTLPDRRRLERRLDQMTDLIYRFDLERLGAGEASNDGVFEQAPIDAISHLTFAPDPSLAPKVKSELNQTASGIPLELADPVLSYIHYFSTEHGRKALLNGFRRAGRYKDMIERILKQEGDPAELIYLAQAESGFLPRAVSTAHAMGMWQFILGTGELYDLQRTSNFDARFDPELATRAAARHLKDLYHRYGDWYLAMAAYNCGPANVDRAVERTGYADYWELLKRNALPRETANYVPIIVAMTIMAKNPKDYGLDEIDQDAPLEFDDVKVDYPTNIALVADAAQQPQSVIRDLNPALLGSIAPAGYEVHVPKGSGQATLAALEEVPALNRNSWRLHRVASGETLAAIAKEYDTPAGRILAVNNGADSLESGDVLLIPAVLHQTTVRHTLSRRGHGRVHVASSHRRSMARTVASRRVSPRVLHRKAALRTASARR